MADTPRAEWDRLKWRRRNYVRRQIRAQLGGGEDERYACAGFGAEP